MRGTCTPSTDSSARKSRGARWQILLTAAPPSSSKASPARLSLAGEGSEALGCGAAIFMDRREDAGDGEGSKSQTPNSRETSSSKHQTDGYQEWFAGWRLLPSLRVGTVLGFGFWDLGSFVHPSTCLFSTRYTSVASINGLESRP